MWQHEDVTSVDAIQPVFQLDHFFLSVEGDTGPTLVGVIAAETATGVLWATMTPGKGAASGTCAVASFIT